MPRVGLSSDAVVDVAIELVDDVGLDALTLAAVAVRVGVAAPSLYKHIDGLGELRRLIAVRSMSELADRLTAAVLGRSHDDALRQLMLAYRTYALEHPNRYAALPQHPVSDPDLATAGTRVVDVILAVLGAYQLDGPEAIHAARSIRAAAHGFAALQTAGGFQLAEDTDASYELLIHMVIAGLLHIRGSVHLDRQERSASTGADE
ncbi:TetR/AcrR family transcriptional regulator [Frankia sp. AgB32]|uniref:TetR/AcrR family transcriptional regulator n=1 Tax=Frankia sp. AgB32 TaxID=631119 RepID=UPI00200E4794|nr:TetR-like C-terminal domain-containing protein [Frankia sp. AgB32]MCK9894817.1 WHG domain-containing protein [Frankia sp. AgB32]